MTSNLDSISASAGNDIKMLSMNGNEENKTENDSQTDGRKINKRRIPHFQSNNSFEEYIRKIIKWSKFAFSIILILLLLKTILFSFNSQSDPLTEEKLTKNFHLFVRALDSENPAATNQLFLQKLGEINDIGNSNSRKVTAGPGNGKKPE